MPEQLAFNMDCLEAMRQMEDNAFDLAVVDPPYGDGGGSFNGALVGRFGGRFEKYHLSDSQSVNVERERERAGRDRHGITLSACGSRTGITRIGGSWSKKYGKKLLRGM